MLGSAERGEVERIAVQPGRDLAAFEQRGHVVRKARVKVAQRVAQARRILDEYDRIFRQVVERSRNLRVDEWQIFVGCGQRAGLFDALRVVFDVRGKVGMLLFAGRQQAAHGFGQTLGAARREVRQRFHARQAAQRFDLFQTALAAHVERRDRVDLVIPELDAVGVCRLRWEHVQNAAAHRKLPRALNLCAALVARACQLSGQLLKRYGLPGRDRDDCVLQLVGRQRALGGCLYAHGHQAGVRQRVQHGEPTLLITTRYTHNIGQHQVARRQNRHFALGKGLQVARETRCGRVVVS